MRQIPRSRPAVALVLIALGGCEAASNDEAATASLPLADHDIAALLYAGAPRTPTGFLADDPPSGFAQVTTYHVKSGQLATPTMPSQELCTDDWNEAFAWSEEVAAQSSPYLDFVGNEATARYFELDRVPRGLPDRYVRMRVWRCAYLDRDGVDVDAGAGFAGVLNVRPLDPAALRELGEYLWRFTPYNNVDHAVLASDGDASGLGHTLTIASLERGVTCDRVVVREWRHTVGAPTGALSLTDDVVREFGVRRDGASIVTC
jgi:hypothetical protein